MVPANALGAFGEGEAGDGFGFAEIEFEGADRFRGIAFPGGVAIGIKEVLGAEAGRVASPWCTAPVSGHFLRARAVNIGRIFALWFGLC